jgi:hypothetical protein
MEEMESKTAPMSVSELRGQITTVQNVLRNIMKEGVHYGKIPGCGPKPTLLKPGAEKILATFHIGVELDIEEGQDEDHVHFRVTARGVHLPTGRSIGHGIGQASTSEEKYAWRGAVCDQEWEDADPLQRREKYLRSGSKIKQVRTNPSDSANTVLKMAKKRAVVDLCLSATACSDIFTQDIEDMQNGSFKPQAPAPPQRKSERKQDPNDMAEVVKLVSVDVKTGTSREGKPWTKYTFRDDKGVSYSTFSETLAKRCQGAVDTGLDARIIAESSKWGNNIVEITPAN